LLYIIHDKITDVSLSIFAWLMTVLDPFDNILILDYVIHVKSIFYCVITSGGFSVH
jgi:hypothetical protein